MLFDPILHIFSASSSTWHIPLHFRVGAYATLFSLLLGCQQRIPVPTEAPTEDPTAQWEDLLSQVSAQGTAERPIDWSLLTQNQDILEHYIAWTGTIGPQSNRRSDNAFPKKGRTNYQLVHFVNAYNAWMLYSFLYNQLDSLPNHTLPTDYQRKQAVFIDGEYMSFHHVKMERLLANFQEARIHFMLYSLDTQSPSLRFWEPNTWRKEVDQQAKQFLKEKGAIQEGDHWLFHPMFKDYADDFVDWSEFDTLCAYLENVATGDLKVWLQSQTTCALQFFAASHQLPHSRAIPSDTDPNSPSIP